MVKKYQNYRPIWNEYLFDAICRDADAYWAEWRKKRKKRGKPIC
jgi:hypothetical protein